MLKKPLLLAATCLVLVACSEENSVEQEQLTSDVGIEQGNAETELSGQQTEEQNNEEQSEDTSNEKVYTNDDILTAIQAMYNWGSYESNYSYVEQYIDEERVEFETNIQRQYVDKPYQVYEYGHTLGFGSEISETFSTDDYTITNYQQGGWEKILNDEYELKNHVIPLATVFEEMIAASSNFSTYEQPFEGEIHTTGIIDSEERSRIFQQLQIALFFDEVATEDMEGLEGYLSLIETDELLDDIYFEFFLDEEQEQFTRYRISIFFTTDVSGEFDSWEIEERFERINDIQQIDIEEEALYEAGVAS